MSRQTNLADAGAQRFGGGFFDGEQTGQSFISASGLGLFPLSVNTLNETFFDALG